jgi:tRNA(Ile)-lysidine synthase
MTGSPELDPDRLGSRIIDSLGVPPDEPWYVAYSGGIDSTVLLHCLLRIATPQNGIRVVALHADHGLSPNAPDWRARCERQCREWGVEFRAAKLVMAETGGGPEGRAREARYRWLRDQAGEGGWLFTAHHRGDQAETVIERLSRGSGPRGLRGMRPVSRLRGMNVVRPLLDCSREAIRDHAQRHRLEWITDESNDDTRLTRNFIRRRVLPVMAERWPGIETALARTAASMADAEHILEQAAVSDLDRLDERPVRGDRSLGITALKGLEEARQRNVLRYWVQREYGVTLSYRRLQRVVAAVGAHPAPAGGLEWPPVALRAHHGRLYLLHPREPEGRPRHWNLRADIDLEGMTLRALRASGEGLKAAAAEKGVEIDFRHGGEKCRLPGRRHHHSLKHVLQEAGIPPWQRPTLPLIKINGEIAAIPGVVYCDPYAAAPGEDGLRIEIDSR